MAADFEWLVSRGEIASRLRELDWSRSPVGTPDTWPQSFRSAINLCLTSKFPMYVWWGAEQVNIYNDAYIPIVGNVRHPAMLGRPAREMWPEIWPTMFGMWEKVFKSGEAVHAEDQIFLLERNGFTEECHFSFSFSPALDESGRVAGAVAIVVETTSKIRAEKESEESRKRLEDFFMQSPIPMVILEGPEHVFSLANPPYEKFVGRKVQGKRLMEAFSESEAGYYRGLLDEVYRTGQPYNGHELPLQLSDAQGVLQNHWLNVAYHPFRDSSGAIRGVLTIVLDVTDLVNARRKAEVTNELLMVERHQFETIFQQSPAAMVLWTGQNFVFEKVNPEYQAIFPDRILQGKPFLEACPEFRDQPFEKLLQDVLQTGVPFVGKEVLARHSDYAGGPLVDHYYDFTYMRVNDVDGNPYGVYDHAIDVTAQVLARRTLEENEKRLQELATNLSSAVVARDTFLGIASHELKTPLTSLKLQTQINRRLLRRQGEQAFSAERIDKFLDNTLLQAERLERLVDDMLDVSRISSGRLTMNIVETDLSALVHEVVERFRPQLEAKGCRVTEEIAPGIVVDLDGSRIEQVLINFITNTLKYAPGKPVSVAVKQKGSHARVSVRDEGAGIAAVDHGRIFERFERATNSGVSGLGLGLYICKQIVQGHRGTIAVDSAIGKGSTFTFELPLRV